MTKSPTTLAEALSHAHTKLLDDLSKLEEAARAPAEEGAVELHAELGRIHQHVTAHFRFEEQDGYMEPMRKREPRLERKIQHLGAEHRRLTQSLEALLGEARTATNLTDPSFREKVRAWVEQVRDHETRENQVVQDAFNLDISAED
jgi:hemerythrin-like domain-containing protein